MNIPSWLSSMRSKEICTDWYEDADRTNRVRDLDLSKSCTFVFYLVRLLILMSVSILLPLCM